MSRCPSSLSEDERVPAPPRVALLPGLIGACCPGLCLEPVDAALPPSSPLMFCFDGSTEVAEGTALVPETCCGHLARD